MEKQGPETGHCHVDMVLSAMRVIQSGYCIIVSSHFHYSHDLEISVAFSLIFHVPGTWYQAIIIKIEQYNILLKYIYIILGFPSWRGFGNMGVKNTHFIEPFLDLGRTHLLCMKKIIRPRKEWFTSCGSSMRSGEANSVRLLDLDPKVLSKERGSRTTWDLVGASVWGHFSWPLPQSPYGWCCDLRPALQESSQCP